MEVIPTCFSPPYPGRNAPCWFAKRYRLLLGSKALTAGFVSDGALTCQFRFLFELEFAHPSSGKNVEDKHQDKDNIQQGYPGYVLEGPKVRDPLPGIVQDFNRQVLNRCTFPGGFYNDLDFQFKFSGI